MVDTCAVCGVELRSRRRHLLRVELDERLVLYLALCRDHADSACNSLWDQIRLDQEREGGTTPVAPRPM